MNREDGCNVPDTSVNCHVDVWLGQKHSVEVVPFRMQRSQGLADWLTDWLTDLLTNWSTDCWFDPREVHENSTGNWQQRNQLTHWLTHILIVIICEEGSLTHSHSLVSNSGQHSHSPIHSLIHPLTTHSPAHSLTHVLVVDGEKYPLTKSGENSLLHSLVSLLTTEKNSLTHQLLI